MFMENIYEKTDFFAPKTPSFHSIFHFVECPHVKVYGLFQLWFCTKYLALLSSVYHLADE